MQDLDIKIAKVDEYLQTKAGSSSEKERFYERIIKLSEEVGELNEAVLYENDTSQRSKNKKIDLNEELADVIICGLLLAKSRNVNIWDLINKKIDKQFERFNLK